MASIPAFQAGCAGSIPVTCFKYRGDIMSNSKKVYETIMLDDGCGFGDMVACCPNCKMPFDLPFYIVFSDKKPEYYPCRYCGSLLKIPE